MAEVLATGSSVPSSISGSLSRSVPDSPSQMVLALFGIYLPKMADRVILDATVGVSTSVLNPTVIFRVFRDQGIPVFTVRQEVQVSVGQSQSVSFQAVEMNVPAGGRSYYITAEIENGTALVNEVTVTGPVTFSGIAFGN